MDLRLVQLSVTGNLLGGLVCGAGKILAELLETRTGEGSSEVDALEEGVDFD